jgi:hypothetical protein
MNVMQTPQRTMMSGIYNLGLIRFNKMFEIGSNS